MTDYQELNKLSYDLEVIEIKKREIKKQMKEDMISKFAEDIIKEPINLRECKKLLKDLIQEIKYIESK